MADDLLNPVFYKLIFGSTMNILYIFRALNTYFHLDEYNLLTLQLDSV